VKDEASLLRTQGRVFLEFQRDWAHRETYEAARAVVTNNGGYEMGLAYAREMTHLASPESNDHLGSGVK